VEILQMKWRTYVRQLFWVSSILQLVYLFLLGMLSNSYVHVTDPDYGWSMDDVRRLDSVIFCISIMYWVVMGVDLTAGTVALQQRRRIITAEEEELRASEVLAQPKKDAFGLDYHARRKALRSRIGSHGLLSALMPISVYDLMGWIGQAMLTAHFFAFMAHFRSTASTVFLSLGICFTWHSSLQLCVAWRHFGVLAIIIRRVILRDLASFGVLLAVSIVAFSQALRLLDVDINGEFKTEAYSMLALFRMVLGDKPSWSKASGAGDSAAPWLSVAYYLVFSAYCSIVLLRLLISMFNETYAAVKKEAENEWLLSWGQGILKMERRVRLVLPSRLTQWMAIDDDVEEGHSYVFQRLQHIEAKGAKLKSQTQDTEEKDRLRQSLKEREEDLADLQAVLHVRSRDTELRRATSSKGPGSTRPSESRVPPG